jgi:hypothetical protein
MVLHQKRAFVIRYVDLVDNQLWASLIHAWSCHDMDAQDYRGLHEPVWNALVKAYGGGPTLIRGTLNIYAPPWTPPTATPLPTTTTPTTTEEPSSPSGNGVQPMTDTNDAPVQFHHSEDSKTTAPAAATTTEAEATSDSVTPMDPTDDEPSNTPPPADAQTTEQ